MVQKQDQNGQRIFRLTRSRQTNRETALSDAAAEFFLQCKVCQVAGFLQLPLTAFKWCH